MRGMRGGAYPCCTVWYLFSPEESGEEAESPHPLCSTAFPSLNPGEEKAEIERCRWPQEEAVGEAEKGTRKEFHPKKITTASVVQFPYCDFARPPS
jgi:hypothetical protein